MIVSIRPAPHAKACALGKTSGCDNHDPAVCRTSCTSCCELKHSWQLGEKLRDELESRGHTVQMADFTRQLARDDATAAENTRAEIDRLMALGSQLHLALHTNSASSSSVRRVSVGYKEGSAAGKAAADKMVGAIAAVYPGTVTSCTYPFIELNRPSCLALYLEMGFANSNREDAAWLHGHIPQLAAALADGVENIVAQKKEEAHILYQAKVTCTYDAGIGIWQTNEKQARLTLAPKGEKVDVLAEKDEKGFCLVAYGAFTGYADSRYLTPVQEAKQVVIPCKNAEEAALLLALFKGASAS